jgi:hypothetical protein
MFLLEETVEQIHVEMGSHIVVAEWRGLGWR